MNLIERALAAAQTLPTLNPLASGTGFADIFTRVVNWALIIAAGLAVIYLIYSGILYITSAGNAEQAKKAQQGILNAIIGIVVILLAYFIVGAVAGQIGGSATPGAL